MSHPNEFQEPAHWNTPLNESYWRAQYWSLREQAAESDEAYKKLLAKQDQEIMDAAADLRDCKDWTRNLRKNLTQDLTEALRLVAEETLDALDAGDGIEALNRLNVLLGRCCNRTQNMTKWADA